MRTCATIPRVFVIPAVLYPPGSAWNAPISRRRSGSPFPSRRSGLATGLLWHEALPLDAVSASFGAIVPALIGMAVGGWLRRRLQPAIFRRWFFFGLAILGVQILWQALS